MFVPLEVIRGSHAYIFTGCEFPRSSLTRQLESVQRCISRQTRDYRGKAAGCALFHCFTLLVGVTVCYYKLLWSPRLVHNLSREDLCTALHDTSSHQQKFLYALRKIPLLTNGVNKQLVGHSALNSISAQCCIVYPTETGFQFENTPVLRNYDDSGTTLRVSMNIRHFMKFYKEGLPQLERLRLPFVLVTCCDDDNVPWELFSCSPLLNTSNLHLFLKHDLLIRWYTQNADIVAHSGKRIGFSKCADEIARGSRPDSDVGGTWAHKVKPIPIGFRISIDGTTPCTAAKLIDKLSAIISKPPKFEDRSSILLVAVPSASLLRDRRRGMVDKLSNTSHVKIVTQRIDTSELYNLMSQHMFVAAPASHGQDTYRFWETLYTGAVPVLLHGPLDSFYAQFPCILLDDWSQVSETSTRSWKQQILQNFGPNPSSQYRWKLSSQYWVDAIKSETYSRHVENLSG